MEITALETGVLALGYTTLIGLGIALIWWFIWVTATLKNQED